MGHRKELDSIPADEPEGSAVELDAVLRGDAEVEAREFPGAAAQVLVVACHKDDLAGAAEGSHSLTEPGAQLRGIVEGVEGIAGEQEEGCVLRLRQGDDFIENGK